VTTGTEPAVSGMKSECDMKAHVTDVVGGVAAHCCFDHRQYDGIMFPTLRRIVSRRDDSPKVTGRTGFLLDYIELEVRR
jgi:hypothetical protein